MSSFCIAFRFGLNLHSHHKESVGFSLTNAYVIFDSHILKLSKFFVYLLEI